MADLLLITKPVVRVISVGLQGPPGAAGQDGHDGADGPAGETGQAGPSGSDAPRGVFAGTENPNGSQAATGPAIYLQDTGLAKPLIWLKKTSGTSNNEWV